MNYLIFFLIIIVAILIIKFFYNSSVQPNVSDKYSSNEYVQPNVELKYSFKIKGRGVFATKNYAQGEIIEVCPGILQKTEHVKGRVLDYVFTYDDDNSIIAFGYCSMYNHSDTPNAEWEVLDTEKMRVTATQDINRGDEIFVSYGSAYWETRKSNLNKK